jgi:hypothetical protein
MFSRADKGAGLVCRNDALIGTNVSAVVIQARNFTNWVPVLITSPFTGTFQFTDTKGRRILQSLRPRSGNSRLIVLHRHRQIAALKQMAPLYALRVV